MKVVWMTVHESTGEEVVTSLCEDVVEGSPKSIWRQRDVLGAFLADLEKQVERFEDARARVLERKSNRVA